MSQNLLKSAIADAKQVRTIALENAKKTLAEAFTPQLNSMLNAKLNENDEFGWEDEMNEDEFGNEGGLEEDFDLDAILAELTGEDEMEFGGEDELFEAKDEEKDDDAEDKPKPKAKDDKDSKPKSEPKAPAKPKDDEDKDVGDMSVSELEDLIRDIISSEVGPEDSEMSVDATTDEFGDGAPMGDDFGGADDFGGGDEFGAEDDEEIDLKEFEDEYAGEEDDFLYENKYKKALHEVRKLKRVVNETNLLNAKLLYLNKIFKAKTLTESQKVKVIKSFDKATTIKESKLVYESLITSLNSTNRTKPSNLIRENLGFASGRTGLIKEQIIKQDPVISRWQQLAGIKK